MFPAWSTALGALIGAAIGSFLNVVIYRVPRGMSLANPPSHCPKCGHRLGVLDLFPLFSFLLSGARCRHCKSPISWRYFVVEVISGTVWGVYWYQWLCEGWDPVRFIVLAAFGSILIAAIFTDLLHYIIPDSFNALLLVLGLAYNGWLIAAGSSDAWTEVGGAHIPASIVGALTGVGVLWGIAFFGRVAFRKDAMGHGDIKLARGIGSVLFAPGALMSFGMAVALGTVIGGLQILVRRMALKQEEDEEIEEVLEDGPESLGSLAKCGLGYALAVDVAALFSKKLDIWWFGSLETSENLTEEDNWQPGASTIPFGPYLALGAVVVSVFHTPLLRLAANYWNWAAQP